MAHEIKIPAVGESITSATIGKWHIGDGEFVESGTVILSIETDKISTELESDKSGILKHAATEGDEIDVGAVVATIEEGEAPEKPEGEEGSGESSEKSAKEESPNEEKASGESADENADEGGASDQDGVKATSLARKMAEDQGIDLGKISGTGTGGRITKSDVLSASDSKEQAPAATPGTSEASSDSGDKRTTRRKMSPMRRKIASHLVNAQQEAAILTTFNECDMSAVMGLRKQLQESFVKKHDVKLGFMSFFIKAVVDALDAVPSVNARIEGDEIVENHFHDIGVAVGTEKGLIVPVIRDCADKSFAQIEKDIIGHAVNAREGKIQLSDLQGGVFTITNGGIYGSLLSTPILNPPQSGILGMHSIQERPIAVNGEVVIRPMMYLALSYDHRIVDGKEAVTFLVRVKECIENPERMLLGV